MVVEWNKSGEPAVNYCSCEFYRCKLIIKADLEFFTGCLSHVVFLLGGAGCGVAFIPMVKGMRCLSARHTLIANVYGRLFSRAEYTMGVESEGKLDISINYRGCDI